MTLLLPPGVSVSVADKGVKDRLNVATPACLNVAELGERSGCHPGCFAARVRKRLKEKEMAFAFLQKSDPFATQGKEE
jgi:hypothetical protein